MNAETNNERKLAYWWVPLIFGTIFILIGLWILRSPTESFEKITKVIGVIVLVSGTTQVLFTINSRRGIPGWGYQLLGGIIDLAIGIILVMNPTLLLKIITLFVGAWLIINSITFFMKAAEDRKADLYYWKWKLIQGIILLLVAILIIWHPVILSSTIAIWTALAFIVLGILRIYLTIRLRRQSV
jgi:uncharacterized membrane protein HdeD (DUF308 family)